MFEFIQDNFDALMFAAGLFLVIEGTASLVFFRGTSRLHQASRAVRVAIGVSMLAHLMGWVVQTRWYHAAFALVALALFAVLWRPDLMVKSLDPVARLALLVVMVGLFAFTVPHVFSDVRYFILASFAAVMLFVPAVGYLEALPGSVAMGTGEAAAGRVTTGGLVTLIAPAVVTGAVGKLVSTMLSGWKALIATIIGSGAVIASQAGILAMM